MLRRMIAALVAAMSLTLLVAVAVAAEGSTGSLTGQVGNGTPGGALPSPVTVTLHSFEGDTAGVPLETLADVEGRFRFDGLPVTETMQYVVTTDYLSITYASDLYTFAEGTSAITASLAVYETTQSYEGIAFDRLHVIIQPGDDGYVSVQEIYVVNNLADRTFIGTEPTGGHIRITGQYSIPVDATDLTLEDAGSERFVSVAGGFVDTLPVAPGQGASQVIVDYRLPYSGDRLSVSHAMGFPAGGVQFFLLGEKLDVVGDEIAFQRTMGSGEQTYRVYFGPAVARGESVSYEITGLKAAGGQAFPTGLVLVIAGALVLLVAAGVGIPLLRGRRAVAEAADLAESAETSESRRQTLVDEIAELDDAREAGHIDETEYTAKRAALKAELIERTLSGDGQTRQP